MAGKVFLLRQGSRQKPEEKEESIKRQTGFGLGGGAGLVCAAQMKVAALSAARISLFMDNYSMTAPVPWI